MSVVSSVVNVFLMLMEGGKGIYGVRTGNQTTSSSLD